MATWIIGDGLLDRMLNPEDSSHRSHVGQQEAERLLGSGADFGRGPLPSLLRLALERQGLGERLKVAVLSPRNESEGDSSELAEPFRPMLPRLKLLTVGEHDVPANALSECIEPEPEARRVLVVGCHTERRILALALFLRNVLGIEEVAVSPHLTASSTREAHLAAFRHHFPNAGIQVLLDLRDVARFVGLDPDALARLDLRPCELGPEEVNEQLGDDQRRILELLCLHWTRAELRPLAGGFSGSLLFLADGWKGRSRTEPLVIKVDDFSQMRRELDGYYQVKDFFGKHVPTFGVPVARGDSIGVAMELAAMEGRPETLQDSFENAEGDRSIRTFLLRLEKALELLGERIYANTRESSWVAPYRSFGLHAEKQFRWFRGNSEVIQGYCVADGIEAGPLEIDQLEMILRLITANEDGVESESCLSHGDLNFANILGDEGDNIWFIDWTHSGRYPLELDFAKLENDVKFVMSKQFDADDLPRLKRFEEFLLAEAIPGPAQELPPTLNFARWDLRFRKILASVRAIRKACFDLKQGEGWLVYRIGLLRYALHTLSFDERRGRGECTLTQLVHAYYSIDVLAYQLVADDFHLRIRAERPTSYPPRQRISIDEAPWGIPSPSYDPPYFVHPSVLEQNRKEIEGAWADPEDHQAVSSLAEFSGRRDDRGRPLNPRGRTGIAGRGLLGRWGPNLSVSAVVTRGSDHLEVLLGRKQGRDGLSLPKGFVRTGEDPDSALHRVLDTETGWTPGRQPDKILFEGYRYDPRQTDHAWVEARVVHYTVEQEIDLQPGGDFEEIRWRPLTPETINRVRSHHASSLREAVKSLRDAGRVDSEIANRLLEATG